MSELYLRLLDRILTPTLLVLALWLFWRGHNQPGGGFIAGLVAAAAFQLQILSRGDQYVRRRIGPLLQPMTGIGLLFTTLAALLGLFGGIFFRGVWLFWQIGGMEIELGTPQLLDLGVFLVVMSVVVSYLLSLGGSQQDEHGETLEEKVEEKVEKKEEKRGKQE
jgi:multisubunit Na+/H+ antiporter MnhB subunit